MSLFRRDRTDTTWEERFTTTVSLLEEAIGKKVKNPDDYVANIICNGCGRLVGATINTPPEGWRLGRFGEPDFCPDCCSL